MIRKLSSELIREIAAGEVISSPVDVVRELFENALDAGANRLDIELDQGGISRMVIVDNGSGIPKAELPLAVEQHSTSKLESLTSIRTLGFRGEGLYAIRYAATMKLTSRPAAQLGGVSLVVEGDTLSLSEHAAPQGTRVEVCDLFARLPARRAALDAPAEELRKIMALLGQYLLHHPRLKLRLSVDAEEKWQYAGGNYREAAKFLWGPLTANRLLNLEAAQEELRLEGLISRPELTRSRRDRLLLAINGRPVQWQERWFKAILESYREMLTGGQYPVGILNLSLPTESVLVNTAPDKRQVRLLQETKVLNFLREAVQNLLSAHPLAAPLPSFQPQVVSHAPRHSFPQLRYLGRYRDLYLLAEADGNLWVVDQHAAHERIIYEELLRRYQAEAPVELAEPELIPLSPEESDNYLAQEASFANVGLCLEPFGGHNWRIRQIPAFLLGHVSLLPEVIRGSLASASLEDAWRRIIGRFACLPAIKAGHPLAQAQAQTLLEALRACQTPWVCPHGRPTALVLSELELARRFGRRGVRASEVQKT